MEKKQRLDNYLLSLNPQTTRSQIKRAITEGRVIHNDEVAYKAGIIVDDGDVVELQNETQQTAVAEDIALEFVHVDERLAIVNKPRGMVVHPGAGIRSGTMLNALLHHLSGSEGVLRAGIVHRLDKNTAGLLVVARTPETMTRLSKMFEERKVKRTYLGLVEGHPPRIGTINKNITRDPRNRVLFTTHDSAGRAAVTHFEVAQYLVHPTTKRPYSLVRFNLETGRTHQIRVHAKSIGHPLVGDPEYNPNSTIKASGQMLEAVELSFDDMHFKVEPTTEFAKLLNIFICQSRQ